MRSNAFPRGDAHRADQLFRRPPQGALKRAIESAAIVTRGQGDYTKHNYDAERALWPTFIIGAVLTLFVLAVILGV